MDFIAWRLLWDMVPSYIDSKLKLDLAATVRNNKQEPDQVGLAKIRRFCVLRVVQAGSIRFTRPSAVAGWSETTYLPESGAHGESPLPRRERNRGESVQDCLARLRRG